MDWGGRIKTSLVVFLFFSTPGLLPLYSKYARKVRVFSVALQEVLLVGEGAARKLLQGKALELLPQQAWSLKWVLGGERT